MYAPPKKNTEYILYVGLISQSDTKTFKSNPTIASGDFKVSTDGGAFANLTTLPTVTPASGKAVKITLSAAEMNGDNILLVASDAAGAEWCDLILILHPASKQFNDIGIVTTLPSIPNNWITTAGIADGAITAAKFASGAFDAVWTVTTRTITSLPAITAGWITSTGIADGAVTAAKFGAGALDAVWSTGSRTLTSFGSLVNDTVTAIWNAAPIDFTALSSSVNAIGTIVTTINNKIGAFTGSGINTILGFFQALMRNDVSIPSDVGGTYNDADHSLQALAADIAAINVSGGTGARVVTITVNDGTSPLENAKVRAYLSASENYVLSSNASGVVVFNLDDGTWTISITKPGYSFTSQLLVVNGNESQTYSMTQEVVTPNPDPDKSTVTITCYDAKTELESGVKIYLEQMTIPTSSENIAFSGAAQEYISGVNGQIELTLWRNAKYRYRRGQEKDWIEFTPNAATYDVTSIVGY